MEINDDNDETEDVEEKGNMTQCHPANFLQTILYFKITSTDIISAVIKEKETQRSTLYQGSPK